MKSNQLSKIFAENWDDIKENLQDEWKELTNDNIETIQGSLDTFIEVLEGYKYQAPAIKKQLKNFLNDADIDLKETKESISEDVSRLKDILNESLNDYCKKIKEKSVDVEEKTVAYLKENPLKTIGVAVLSGFLLGALFKFNKS